MTRTFRIFNRSGSTVMAAGLSIALILAIQQVIYTADLRNRIKISALLIILIPMLFIYLSKATYKLVFDGTNIFDKDILHRKRILTIDEVKTIENRMYSDNLTHRYGGGSTVEAPALINGKFSKFPRYRISEDIVRFVHDSYPAVKIDTNYSNLIK